MYFISYVIYNLVVYIFANIQELANLPKYKNIPINMIHTRFG